MAKSLQILVVDDHVNFLETMMDLFEEKGFHCVGVTSGPEAINKVKEMNFKGILMDIKMPKLNGVETYKEIKKIRPEIPVVMMTAYKIVDLIEDARSEGVQAILKKPLDLEAVLSIFEKGKNE